MATTTIMPNITSTMATTTTEAKPAIEIFFESGFPIPGVAQGTNTAMTVAIWFGWQLFALLFLLARAQWNYIKKTREMRNLFITTDPPWMKLFTNYNTIFVHMIATSLSVGLIIYCIQEQKRSGDGFQGRFNALGLLGSMFAYRLLSGLNLWIVDYALIKPNARLAAPGVNVICSAENKATAWQLLFQLADINVFIELAKTFEEDRPEVTIQFRDIRTMEALITSTFVSIVSLDFILEKGITTQHPSRYFLIVAVVAAWWSITSVLIKRDEVVFFEFREEANTIALVPHPLYIGRRVWRFCEVGSRLLVLTLFYSNGQGFGYWFMGLVALEVFLFVGIHLAFRREKFVFEFIYAFEFVFVHPNIAMEASHRWKNWYYSFRFYEHCAILLLVWLTPSKHPNRQNVVIALACAMTIVTRIGFFLLRFYMSLPSFDKLIMSDHYSDEIEIQIRQHPNYLHEYRNKEPMQIAIDSSACNNFKWLEKISKNVSMIKLRWAEKNLRKWDVSGMSFARVNLFNTNFRDAICFRTKFNFAQLNGVNFHRANLQGAGLKGSSLKGADLSMCRLDSAVLDNTNLSNANLIRASLVAAQMKKANLTKCKLHGADLSRATMSDSDLSGANLYKASLENADLSGAKLRYVNCKSADFTNTTLDRAVIFGGIGEIFDRATELKPKPFEISEDSKEEEMDEFGPSSSSDDDQEYNETTSLPRNSRILPPMSHQASSSRITFSTYQVSVASDEKTDDEVKRDYGYDDDESQIAYLNPQVRQLSANSDSSAGSVSPLGRPEQGISPMRVESTTATTTSNESSEIGIGRRRQESLLRISSEDERHDSAP